MARTMKDSGVEWIGEIPENWETVRTKNTATLFNGNSIKDDEKSQYEDSTDAIPYISTKDIDNLHNIDYSNGMYVKNDDPNFKVAHKNSTLMCIEGGSAGIKKAKLKQDVCFVNKLCCFEPKSIDSDYLYYFLNNPKYEDHFKSLMSGLIGGVSISDLKNINCTLPPISEQQKIAEFLDDKCGAIDEIIRKTEQSIEEYKKLKQSVITKAVTKGIRPNRPMKDCNIGWIGEIPEDWEIKKIKYLFRLRDERNTLPLSEVNLISLYTDLGVVQHCDIEATTGNKAQTADGYKKVYNDDIVVNIILCWMGAIGRSAYNGVTSPAYDVYKPINKTNSKFYHYYFRTKGFNGECYQVGRGIMLMRWRTYSEQFKAIKVVEPPLEEQQEIVAYLDEKCSEIDALIKKKQNFLTELANYKKSLIYEYVTGKKEVA